MVLCSVMVLTLLFTQVELYIAVVVRSSLNQYFIFVFSLLFCCWKRFMVPSMNANWKLKIETYVARY